jgi:hypothetical protein
MSQVMVVTAVAGCAVVFLLGCIIGFVTEPVPGMPGEISALWWLAPALVVVAALPTLVICQRALTLQAAGTGDHTQASVGSSSTESISEDVGPGLDQCPTEALTSAS